MKKLSVAFAVLAATANGLGLRTALNWVLESDMLTVPYGSTIHAGGLGGPLILFLGAFSVAGIFFSTIGIIADPKRSAAWLLNLLMMAISVLSIPIVLHFMQWIGHNRGLFDEFQPM